MEPRTTNHPDQTSNNSMVDICLGETVRDIRGTGKYLSIPGFDRTIKRVVRSGGVGKQRITAIRPGAATTHKHARTAPVQRYACAGLDI